MAAEDDYFMVIIKEESKLKDPDPDTVEIKQEYLDDEELQDPSTIESILEQATLHGEVIEIKEEPIEVEYLSDVSAEWEPKKKRRGRKRGVKNKPPTTTPPKPTSTRSYVTKKKVKEEAEINEDFSFISQLKKENPHLANDEEALITELAKIMIETRAPSPPPGSYVSINDEEFSCTLCADSKPTEPAIRRHYQEKHGLRFFRCYSCIAEFRSVMNLYRHELVCHGPDAGVALRARARAVTKARPSRPYYDKARAIRRRPPAKESGETPRKFACPECPATYTNKATLHSHMNLHRGVREYVCEDCGAAYYHKTSLIKHSFKHKANKYVCDVCGREFSQKYSIVAHFDTHLPQKKHACEHEGCDRRFSTKMALRLHRDRTHLLLPPPCACRLCPRRFARMSLLKTHMKTAHGLMLMTRNMFFKSLPTLSDSQVLEAQVVLRQVEPGEEGPAGEGGEEGEEE